MAEDKLYDFQPFEDPIDKQKIPPISTFAKPTGYENGSMQTVPNPTLDMAPVSSGYPHYHQSQRIIYKNGGYSQAPNPAAFYVVAAAGNQSVVYPATSGASSSTSTSSQSNQSLPSNMAVPHMLNSSSGNLEAPTSGTLPPTPPVSADEKDNNNEDPEGKNAALTRLLSQGKDPMRVPHTGYPPHQIQGHHNFMPPTQHMSAAPGPMSPLGGDPMSAYGSRSRAPSKRRSMKKPVLDEMKDDKYFERRKKNNLAAKRSRDARKMREEDIARRATYLQKENDALKTQMETLREEAYALRQLLAQKSS